MSNAIQRRHKKARITLVFYRSQITPLSAYPT
nr:MAG TPA: hypothetical protein [Caudoviricetes sp.]